MRFWDNGNLKHASDQLNNLDNGDKQLKSLGFCFKSYAKKLKKVVLSVPRVVPFK